MALRSVDLQRFGDSVPRRDAFERWRRRSPDGRFEAKRGELRGTIFRRETCAAEGRRATAGPGPVRADWGGCVVPRRGGVGKLPPGGLPMLSRRTGASMPAGAWVHDLGRAIALPGYCLSDLELQTPWRIGERALRPQGAIGRRAGGDLLACCPWRERVVDAIRAFPIDEISQVALALGCAASCSHCFSRWRQVAGVRGKGALLPPFGRHGFDALGSSA